MNAFVCTETKGALQLPLGEEPRTIPHEKTRGQTQERDPPQGEQAARRSGANVNQLLQPWVTSLWL